MIELFHASSVIERLELGGTILNGGVIHWYITDSKHGQRPYADLIDGYKAMDPMQKMYSEEFIDELLTVPDIVLLARFLDTIQSDEFHIRGNVSGLLQTRQVELPIGGGQLGYRHRPVGGGTSHFAISNHDTYDLPFIVQGYIDISEEGNAARLRNSAHYVRRVLQTLGVDRGIKLNDIQEAVGFIYRNDGLYVTDAISDNILEHIELPEGSMQ